MCMWSAALIGVGLKHLALQPWYFAACGQWSQKSKCSVAQSILSAPRFSLMRLPLNGDPFPAAPVQGACKGNHTMRHHCQHVPSILLQGLLFVMCVIGWKGDPRQQLAAASDSLPHFSSKIALKEKYRKSRSRSHLWRKLASAIAQEFSRSTHGTLAAKTHVTAKKPGKKDSSEKWLGKPLQGKMFGNQQVYVETQGLLNHGMNMNGHI